MRFYESAPVWVEKNQCPARSPRARPNGSAVVHNARAIQVKAGRYRGAIFDGVFALAEHEPRAAAPGWREIDVYCCWFGHRVRRGPLRISVNFAQAEVIDDYSGRVVVDLAT